MGLKGDFDEIQKVWRNSSLPMRLWLVFSGFVATTSIATLSDTIFRWKGFIKDGVVFYQEYVSSIILEKIKLFWHFTAIPPGIPDLLVLSTIYIGANIKIAKNLSNSESAKTIAMQSSASYIGTACAVLAAMFYTEKTLDFSAAFGLFCGSMVGASISYIRSKSAARMLWFIYSLTPFATVLIFGAINSGLTRTV